MLDIIRYLMQADTTLRKLLLLSSLWQVVIIMTDFCRFLWRLAGWGRTQARLNT